jgi:hypothetical protein
VSILSAYLQFIASGEWITDEHKQQIMQSHVPSPLHLQITSWSAGTTTRWINFTSLVGRSSSEWPSSSTFSYVISPLPSHLSPTFLSFPPSHFPPPTNPLSQSPLAFAMLRHRLGEKIFFKSVIETAKWTPMFVLFFGGISFHLLIAILCHFFSIKMEWTATAKEVEAGGFRIGLDKIVRDFKWMYLVIVPVMGGEWFFLF